jgi:hypothetical protein
MKVKIRHLVVISALAAAWLSLRPPTPLSAQGVATHGLGPAPRRAPSGRAFPVSFVNVAGEAGLRMRSTSGSETSKKYIIEANGSGVAFIDYNNDGREDIFLVNGSRLEGFADQVAPTNHLYRNEGGGKFKDVTSDAGVGRSGWGNGVCVGDFDNDGFEDLFVTYWGPNVLYRNNGHGGFEDVTQHSGLPVQSKEWSSGCTFFDYDRDGHLDLLVTSYMAFDMAHTPAPGNGSNCEWKGMPVFCGPRGMPFGKVTLYHNRGDGTFEDVTVKSGISGPQGFYAFTPIAMDLDSDGWPDVYIACDSTPSILFRNNRNGTFSDIGTETGVAFNEHGFEQGGMGVAVGDIDNDGLLDMIKTNFAGDHPNVYHNIGDGIFEDIVIKAGLAVNPQYVGWGIGLVDLDNDGWKDVFQVNGHVYPELDARGGSEAYRNPRLVYRNLGKGIFEDVSAMAGPGVAEKMSSRGAAFGDFDNDGDIDVLVMNMGQAPSLLRNDLKSENHWIKVKLEGTKSNRSAIGAIVSLTAGGMTQTDAVLSQSSYISSNDRRLHFGLGAADHVDRFTVRWPSGAIEQFPGVAAGGLVRLIEGSGETQFALLPK